MTDLPQGWREAFLSDVCSSFQYGWTSGAEKGQGLGLLRTTDLTHPPVKWSEVPQCKELPKDVDKYLVRTGDFFISRAGSVGVSAFVEEVPRDCVFASYLIRLQASDRVIKRFLKWFLLSPEYWKQVSEASAGIALQNINATKLKSMLLPLPPLAEQERIVEILEEQFSRLDSALAGVKAVREKAKAFRRSLLHSAFSGELTGGTEEWREVALGEVCRVYQPKTISTKELMDDGEYVVFGANGVIGRYDKFNHEESEVTVTCRGATCGTVNVTSPKAWITGNAMVCKPNDESLTKPLLALLLRSVDFTSVITGTAQPQITRSTLAPLLVRVPPLAEQERIVSLLEEQFSRLDKALEVANQLEARIASERRSLLHSAFTGALTATWRQNND